MSKALVLVRNVLVMTTILTALFAGLDAIFSQDPDPLVENVALAFAVAIIIELRQFGPMGRSDALRSAFGKRPKPSPLQGRGLGEGPCATPN